MHPNAKGDISVLCLSAALMSNGYVVLKPVSDHYRFDLIIYKEEIFNRIQCKTGRIIDNGIVFNTSSVDAKNENGRRDYRGEIEFFGVYCPELNKSYLIPVGHVGINAAKLRLSKTKNNQKKKILLAENYELLSK